MRPVVAAVTLALVALAPLGQASRAHALTFTCEGITRKGLADPALATFTGKFGDARRGGPAINGAGDVTFFAKAKFAQYRLYLYPAAGMPSILAEGSQAAPGGSLFSRFERPSINDAGDVAFFSKLFSGEGIFIKPAAGAAFAVARTGGPAPGGGNFSTFRGLARINAAGDVAFLANLSNGMSGVYRYDAATTSLSLVARTGDVALDGRQICNFVAPSVGLGASRVAFEVVTSTDCGPPTQPQKIGIYHNSGAGTGPIVQLGDPAPIPGTTFTTFYGDPDVNALNQVLIRANAGGPPLVTGLFLFDPVSAATTLVGTGDSAPGGGTIRTLAEPSLTDDGRAGVRASLQLDVARAGIYLFGSTDEAVVRSTDPAPTDAFGAGATYQKLFEEIGVDRSGTHVTFTANVKIPGFGTRLGLLRCSGS